MEQLLSFTLRFVLQPTGYRSELIKRQMSSGIEFRPEKSNQLKRSRIVHCVANLRSIMHRKRERVFQGLRNLARRIHAWYDGVRHSREPLGTVCRRHPTRLL